MSGPLVSASAAFVAKNSRIPPYAIEQSLRFDGSTSASRTPSSAGNRKTWTFSFWLKRASLSGDQTILMTPKNSGYSRIDINSASGSSVNFLQWNGSAWDFKLALTNNRLRDPSAWYHIIVAVDTTQSTASNRVKFYVNGSLETDLYPSFDTYPSQNYDTELNGTGTHYLGVSPNYGLARLNGYLAEVNYIDGSQLAATDFGEYDDNGVWRPIEYSGSYTGNSYYLKFDAADLGGDSSGLSNDFSVGPFVTSGTGTDVMSDTPTTNWCTFNPVNTDGGTLSNGNLDASGTSCLFQSTIMVNSGKYYFEFTKNGNGDNQFGIAYGGDVAATDAFRRAWRDNNGSPQWLTDAAIAGSGTPESCAVNDVVGVALDMDNNAVYFSKNGTYMNSGDPTSGSSKTGAIWTDLAGQSWGPNAGGNANGVNCTLNCGQRAFAYTPPSGFLPLNTKNLPAPTVKDGSKYFNTVLYTGNGTSASSTQAITGVGFQPDFLWVKGRSVTSGSVVWDAVRGVSNRLFTHVTNAEDTSGDWMSSFDTDGFTAKGDANNVNATGQTFVAWNWLAGGSGSSNTDGTITSTVSANPTAGFSIVTWTGTGNNDSYGHGLGVKPAMIIHKRRNSTSDWHVWHQGLPTASPTYDVIYLNLTNAQNSGNNNLFRQDPTSTLIYTGTAASHNVSGGTYVDYVFAEVEGYSKFGSYVGNLNADGPFIWTGFSPAFVMWKRNGVDGWVMKDSVRNTYNTVSTVLYANLSNAESSTQEVDFLSNGFKIRTNSGASNALGDTYIYMAFASNPFGGSGVTPATAR